MALQSHKIQQNTTSLPQNNNLGQAAPNNQQYYGNQPQTPTNGVAIASLVLGIISLVAWLIPLLGVPISILAIVFSRLSVKGGRNGLATAGIVTGIIGLVLALGNWAVSYLLIQQLLQN